MAKRNQHKDIEDIEAEIEAGDARMVKADDALDAAEQVRLLQKVNPQAAPVIEPPVLTPPTEIEPPPVVKRIVVHDDVQGLRYRCSSMVNSVRAFRVVDPSEDKRAGGFRIETPDGVQLGNDGDWIVQLQDGQRVIVPAEKFAEHFTKIR